MKIRRLSAFAVDGTGGNPAGVVLADEFPTATRMQQIAKEVGYSETAFAMPQDDGWRVRYFAPEREVPFCGHATLALGAALAEAQGAGRFDLILNAVRIEVRIDPDGNWPMVTLESPPTHSRLADPALVAAALDLFELTAGDLDPALPPTRAHGGADHLVIGLKDRQRLAQMRYDLETGRSLMETAGLTTIALVVAEGQQLFHARNAFAVGGVSEDPATGAAAAAFAGMLRDIGWPHGGRVVIHQGYDMGRPSRIIVDLTHNPGQPVAVSGQVAEVR